MGCNSSTAAQPQGINKHTQPTENKQNATHTQGFVPTSEKMIEGKYSTQRSLGKQIMTINPVDCLEQLAILSMWSPVHKYCYTDGQHNAYNWRVERGTYKGSLAFKIYPPTKSRKQMRSTHCIALKLPQAKAYQFRSVINGVEKILLSVKPENVKKGEFNLLGEAEVSEISTPTVYYCS